MNAVLEKFQMELAEINTVTN